MKPDYAQIEVEGNLPAIGRKMDFDPDAIAHIMRLLIDLYSDKELAVIRELSTNAIDSHIMAGKPDPIQVDTPSGLSPYLVIRDQGLGLSVEEIYALFGRYGASTKRDTNEATGMLGLGSKSPLTYTNTFTMEAVKDGVRAVVAINRDEEGVGNLTVVDTATTDDPNGVLIRIPARQGNKLDLKAKQFFRYWKPGTILLNGIDPSGLGENAIEITPNIFMEQGSRYEDRHSVVVMGNVPYPAPQLSHTALGIPPGYIIVAYVPIGSVDFAPSREALQDTKKTRTTLDGVVHSFRQGLEGAVQRDVNSAVSPFQAMQKMQTWVGLYTPSTLPDFTWKGKQLPWNFTVPSKPVKDRYGYGRIEYTQKMWRMDKWNTSRRRRQSDFVASIGVERILSSVFITDFNLEKVTPTHRKKATQWLEKHSNPDVQRLSTFILLDFIPEGLELVDKERVVSWDVIKQEKLPKAGTGVSSGRIPGSFDLILGGKKNLSDRGFIPRPTGVPGDEIDQTKPVFYVWGNQEEACYKHVPILSAYHQKYTVICLPANRLDKFKRENPKITNADDEIKRLATLAAKKMTVAQQQALWMQDQRIRDKFLRFKPILSQLKDPDLVKLVKIATTDTGGLLKSREIFQGGGLDFPTAKVTGYSIVEERYKLLGRNIFLDAHVVRYINNEYAYLQEKRGT